MQNPKHHSLLSKVLYNNMLITGFFVLLAWILVTVVICSTVYHRSFEQSGAILNDYGQKIQKDFTSSVLHSEQIAKSSYIIDQLHRTDMTAEEKLIFADYAGELARTNTGFHGNVTIYHKNDTLFESNLLSHADQFANYDFIIQKLEGQSCPYYDPTVTIASSMVNITMYRFISRTDDCVLCYPISLELPREAPYPISVVSSDDPSLQKGGQFQHALNEPFTCVMQVPMKKILSDTMKAFFWCLVLFLVLSALIYYLLYSTARKTVQEISGFIENLNGQELLLDSEIFTMSYDLYELNVIKKTLQKLATEIRRKETENKQLELERLTMQLDPHMLYNSLASIRLDAYRLKNQRTMDLVDSMTQYYRSVLRKDRKLITAREELETIQKYLLIQELSHGKSYRLETYIAPSLTQLRIPPQVLHTFVENCIVHGLSGARTDCVVRIIVTEQNGLVTVELYDNGYGISPEKLEQLNTGTQKDAHIGIYNSLKRLKLTFGDDASVRFESEKNVYTRVWITFRRPEDDLPNA